MCFSAQASFAVSAALTCAGALTLKKAKNTRLEPFAYIPLLFAIQQAAEGFVWLSLTRPSFAFLQQISTGIFLFFAYLVWPTIIPFAGWKTETNPQRKKLLHILLTIGVLFAIGSAYYLLRYGALAQATCDHIAYISNTDININYALGTIIYLILVIVPFLLSSVVGMWQVGILIGLGYLAAFHWFPKHITSVWCFFAAVVSASVLYIVHKNRK